MLTPFYIFQVFSVALWFWDDYYKYASAIVIMSLLSLAFGTYQTRKVLSFFPTFIKSIFPLFSLVINSFVLKMCHFMRAYRWGNMTLEIGIQNEIGRLLFPDSLFFLYFRYLLNAINLIWLPFSLHLIMITLIILLHYIKMWFLFWLTSFS